MLEKLKRQLPAGITDLLHVPGSGRSACSGCTRISTCRRRSSSTARRATAGCARCRVSAKIRTQYPAGVEAHLKRPGRYKLAVAAQYAQAYAAYLSQGAGVGRVALAGSFRRMRETVGDLDILVTAAAPAQAMQRFAAYPEVKQVLSRGETRASVVLQAGIQVDVRVVAEECYGAALHYFTGSKSHNIAVRKLAQERGLKVNEYGVFRGAKRIAGTPRSRCTPWSVCRTSRPSCARIAAKSRRRAQARCRTWWSSSICAGICTCIPGRATAMPASGTWRLPPARAPVLSRGHRAFAPAAPGARPRPAAAGAAERRDRPAQRRAGRLQGAQGHRGGYPRRRHARPADSALARWIWWWAPCTAIFICRASARPSAS